MKLNPNLRQLQESPIFDNKGKEIAWHCATVTQNEGFSGGFHRDRMTARKIAIAEFIERTYVNSLFKTNFKEWQFNKVPTGCGFAVGFNKESTTFRSVCEAVERWTLSKWIDEGFIMDKVKPSIKLKSSIFFSESFESLEYFQKYIAVKINDTQILTINVGAVVGYLGNGAYMGSRASLDIEDVWEHSLLEAYRHFLIVKNSQESSEFPFNRIFHFGRHKEDAVEQIRAANRSCFPVATIDFQKIEPIAEDKNIFIARTILAGGKPWNQGPTSRFLY
jgi:hypothetical protein